MPLALSLTPVVSKSVFIHELHDDGTYQVSPHTDRSSKNVANHWLTHVLAETFLPTVLLYGMLGHYSRGLPLIQCDIPSENGYFDVSALLNTGYFHLIRHSPTD
ncbi:hypothetical protein TNCV_3524931 [Trichonephila clavipes]|uniref:Uncharacterized protein n=1 Tax=Trichonephila clavipes TaxID=2585209 RepID=A0A8X6V6G7_TRICX|nr:hypothetical protein TNCV_3524931 [Trichonephila clavipes]